MGVAVLLGICVGLVISYLIANEFYQIAIMKGFNESKYLWISFFLGVVGYLLVIALPDKNIKNEKPLVDEIPEL